jgi:molybdenum cofactor guanylyltransferase
MLHPDVTGFVLTGGKSTRMGRDKAVLKLEGRTLLDHAVATLRKITGEVCILGPRQLYARYGLPVIEDIYPGCGPLGGIHAALSHTRTQFNLIIAVDTPFLSPEFLAFMAGRAVQSGAVVTTPEIGGYRQPLCSVYSRDFLPIAESALGRATAQSHSDAPTPAPQSPESPPTSKSRDYKIVPLFPRDGTLVITEKEMAQFAFTPEMFENLNTPNDLERARQRSAAGKHLNESASTEQKR